MNAEERRRRNRVQNPQGRANETPEQREARIRANRERNRARRAAESAAKRQRRQEKAAVVHQEAREVESEVVATLRPENNRVKMQQKRELEDIPTREARQDQGRAATQAARGLEDTPMRNEPQRSKSEAVQAARALEDTPMRQEQQRGNSEAMRVARAMESTLEQLERREANRASTQRSRPSQDTPALTEIQQANRDSMRQTRRQEDTSREVRLSSERGARRVSRRLFGDSAADDEHNLTITLQGRIHDYMGPLRASELRSPAFLSVYIHDNDYVEQTRTRMGMSSVLDESTLYDLARMLHDCNPYFNTFRSLREWAVEENSPTPYWPIRHPRMVIHADRRPAGEHVRKYNGPEASEVAALIPGNEYGVILKR